MKTKAAKLFSCCKYELGIFLLLCIQALMNYRSISQMDQYFYLYYLPDFSMGRTSRLLVGSIVNLFTDNPTSEWLDRFARIVLFLTLLFVALVIGKVIRNANEETKSATLVFTLFFVSGSFTLYNFSRFFGLLDIYMFIFAVLAVVCLQHKYLRWLVPVFSVVGVLVNYVFVISYFPLIFFATFYFAVTQKQKVYNFLVLILTLIATVSLSYYSIYSGYESMTITFEEFKQIVEQKSGIDFDEDSFHSLAFGLFHIALEETGLSAEQTAEMNFFEIIKTLSKLIFSMIGAETSISIATITIFIASVFCVIWIMCVKNAETKTEKLLYLSFAFALIFIPVCCIVSTDFCRWIQAGIITQFGLVYLLLNTKDKSFEKTIDQLKTFFADKKLLIIVLYAAIAFCTQRNLGMQ